jgi:hypothetical protein
MFILDATTESIVVVTTLAKNIDYISSWSDHTTTTLTPGNDKGSITTATTTTIVSSPGASTQRQVHYISLCNKDTTAQTLAVHHDTSGTKTLASPNNVVLQAGESLVYTSKDGFRVLTVDGAVKSTSDIVNGIDGYPSPFFKVGTASEAVGVWYCHSKDTGSPGAWSVGASGINGRVTDGTAAGDAGCLLYKNAATGNNYLRSYTATSTVAHSHYLCDVVWVNNGIVVTTTGAQAIATPAFPARDINGSTNGDGYWVGILVTTATTNAGAITNTTLSYTNQAGTAGKTATIASFPATAVIGTVVWFQLAAGDTGVRSIQSITLGTSYVAGAISLFVARPLSVAGVAAANLPSYGSLMTVNPSGVALYNGTCMLPFYISSATTATTTNGMAIVENR